MFGGDAAGDDAAAEIRSSIQSGARPFGGMVVGRDKARAAAEVGAEVRKAGGVAVADRDFWAPRRGHDRIDAGVNSVSSIARRPGAKKPISAKRRRL